MPLWEVDADGRDRAVFRVRVCLSREQYAALKRYKHDMAAPDGHTWTDHEALENALQLGLQELVDAYLRRQP